MTTRPDVSADVVVDFDPLRRIQPQPTGDQRRAAPEVPGRLERKLPRLLVRPGSPPDGLPVFADGVRAATIHAAVAASVLSGSWMDVKAADAREDLKTRERVGGRQ